MNRRRRRRRAIVIAAVVLAAAAGCGGSEEAQSAEAARSGLGARTVQAGEVRVEIEPLNFGEQGAAFGITFDTHSVDLEFDVAREATLEVGGVAWPTAGWDGDGPGGHHRSGTLRFDAAGPAAGGVELRILGLDDPVEATWTAHGT